MSKEIYAKVKDTRVVPLFAYLEYELARQAPNGATIHDRDGLRANLIGWGKLFEREGLHNETFATYQQDHPKFYNTAVDLVRRAKEDFGLYV